MKVVTIRNNCNGYTVNDTCVVNKDYFNYYMIEGEFAENTPKDAIEQYEVFLEIEEWLKNGGSIEPEFTEEEIQKQELQIKINEAKEYLASTDHKFYIGYKPKDGEDLVEIERLRDKAREFIRANKGDE